MAVSLFPHRQEGPYWWPHRVESGNFPFVLPLGRVSTNCRIVGASRVGHCVGVRGVGRFPFFACIVVVRFGIASLFRRHVLGAFPFFFGRFPIIDSHRCRCRSGGFHYCFHCKEGYTIRRSCGDPHGYTCDSSQIRSIPYNTRPPETSKTAIFGQVGLFFNHFLTWDPSYSYYTILSLCSTLTAAIF